jgi:16S rRNA (guanine966-N2)-methyltransferase
VTPSGSDVRPTADRVREAWMSIVRADLPGARVLDLFAGSGALGLEALSRGAASADLVENAPSSLEALRANVAALGADAAQIIRLDAIRMLGALEAGSYDVAFADPPYRRGFAMTIAEYWQKTPFASVLGVEHAVADPVPPGDTRRYGSTAVTFYRL